MRIFDLLPRFPFIISVAWSLMLYVIILFIFFTIYRKIRALNNRRTLIFWKDGTQDIKDYKIKDGRLQIVPVNRLGTNKDKAWTPQIKSENIIPAKQSWKNKIKPLGFVQKDMFIAVEGSDELVTVKGSQDLDVPTVNQSLLLQVMTRPEVAKFIRKCLAKATVNRKVFSDRQFYIFALLIFFNLILTLMVVRGMGLF